jgi:hypothetical protein
MYKKSEQKLEDWIKRVSSEKPKKKSSKKKAAIISDDSSLGGEGSLEGEMIMADEGSNIEVQLSGSEKDQIEEEPFDQNEEELLDDEELVDNDGENVEEEGDYNQEALDENAKNADEEEEDNINYDEMERFLDIAENDEEVRM